MKDATLSELTALVAVARKGSLTTAAEHLGISVGAVSRRLAGLEARLGVRLLNRSTRAVRLSAAGETYLSHVVPALEAITAAGELVRAQTLGPSGEIRVSLPVNFGRAHLALRLPEFLMRYPEVHLDAQFDDRFVDLVAEGFDLAIRIGRLDDSRLVARRLASDRRVLVASPAYLESAGRPRHPRDLLAHQCLHYTNFRGPVVWSFHKAGKQVDIPVRGRFTSNYGLPLTMAAEQGQGLVHSAMSLVGEAIRDGRLVEVLPGWRLPEIGIHAVYPGRKHVPEKVRVFIDFVAEILNGAAFNRA
ncbi:LysR family transcriptional regulator [Alloalcanivorax xenomutans]|uniref:LysR family transcriptional regulator n=1 Tax=Alloalcanivorax xenomutans TaxID=1094342 RepID=UPI003BA8C366